jgi:hypothetical protein
VFRNLDIDERQPPHFEDELAVFSRRGLLICQL